MKLPIQVAFENGLFFRKNERNCPMTERIFVKRQGVRSELKTPQGAMKVVGGGDTNDGLILEEHISPPCEFP
jgi:hypothetical protein